MNSTRDIVTQKELKGICERFDKKQSQRQRIIITRSEDPRNKLLAPTALTNNDADSLMQAGDETVRHNMGSADLNLYGGSNMQFKDASNTSIGDSYQASPDKQRGGRPFQTGKAVKGNALHFRSANGIDDFGGPAILESNERFATIQEAGNTHTEMPSKFSTIHMGSGVQVDVMTPEGSNATMDRIRHANRDKKLAQVARKEKQHKLMDEARDFVLEKYGIKSKV
jgi:hypothetical protein